jgi:hypothetical protein
MSQVGAYLFGNWTCKRRQGKTLRIYNFFPWVASQGGTVLVARSLQSSKAPLCDGAAVVSEGNCTPVCRCASLQLASGSCFLHFGENS